MRHWLLLIFTFSFYLPILTGQNKEVTTVRLILAGDIMGHDSQIESAKTISGYNYDTCFSFVKPYIESSDIAIANLEVTLAGAPYKGYPQFSSPDELADAIKAAGFDIMITANNHSLDRGKKGLERTLTVLEDKRLIYTGTFRNEEEKRAHYPLLVEKNGILVAILNYTYGTNGLKTESPNIVTYIDKQQIVHDLSKAKLARPDFILVTIHWGAEYQREENSEQSELADFIAAQGADAIIGSHPHVVQPLRIITMENRKVPVLYSLGNFISNQRNRYTDGGILFEMTLEKKEGTRIKDIDFIPVWVYKPSSKSGGHHFILLPSNREKAFYNSMDMSEEDYSKMKIFDKDTESHLKELPILEVELKLQPEQIKEAIQKD